MVRIGETLYVYQADENGIKVCDSNKKCFRINLADEPVVIDLLANLANRVHSLEQQLRDTQGNVEKLAEELATVKHESNPKSSAKLLAEAFEALGHYERSSGIR